MKKIVLAVVVMGMIGLSVYGQTTPDESPTSKNEAEVKLKITGLTCAGCATHVVKVLKETKGVLDNHVEYPGDIAIIKYDDKKTKPSELIAAIEKKTSYKAALYIEPREKGN